MKGLKRVIHIYPIWFIIGLIISSIMIYFELRRPKLIMLLVWTACLKDVFLDSRWLAWEGSHFYYLEHAPLTLIVFLIWLMEWAGYGMFIGYVGMNTAFLALGDTILDIWQDINSDPKEYRKHFFDGKGILGLKSKH